MNNIVKIKYKIGKEEIVYWISIFALVSIYVLTSYLADKQMHVTYLITIELVIPIFFLSHLFINLFRCRQFYSLCNEMESNEMEVNINECFIKIQRKALNIKTPRAVEVKLGTDFRTVKTYSVQTNDFHILFFQMYDFGIFRRYIRPVVFMKNNIPVPNFMKNIYLIDTYEKKQIGNDICIKTNKKIADIEYIVLPMDFEI